MKRFLLLVAIVVGAGFVACKQGKGDRCQVQEDCSDGLVCTTAGTCQGSGENNLDANPPPDAGPDARLDAPPADAAPGD